MLRVLVPSDGSDFAVAAARRGLSLLPADAKATVITVVPPVSPVLGVPTTGSGDGAVFDRQTLLETQEARRASARAELDATARHWASAAQAASSTVTRLPPSARSPTGTTSISSSSVPTAQGSSSGLCSDR